MRAELLFFKEIIMKENIYVIRAILQFMHEPRIRCNCAIVGNFRTTLTQADNSVTVDGSMIWVLDSAVTCRLQSLGTMLVSPGYSLRLVTFGDVI